MEEVKRLPLREIRFESPTYLEMVIPSTEMERLHSILEKFFGEPVRPGDTLAIKNIVPFMNKFGGVRSDQFLYYVQKGAFTFYAMIWPWGDKSAATVKIEKIKSGQVG